MITPASEVDKILYKAFEILKNEIRNCLAKLGEECIAKIRDRSSIGYAVYDHGVKQLQSAFRTVLQGGDGSSEGQKMISQLASEYSNAYALVVVAGMNYASHVEALENKDVLASTEIWAKGVINARLERAKKEAIRKIDKLLV